MPGEPIGWQETSMRTNEKYDVFLSYSSVDRPFVTRVAEQLKKRDCCCFLDQWYLSPGHDWVAALENALDASRSVAVFLGPHEMGRWQQRERAWALDRVDRKAADARFALIPVLLPGCAPPLGFLGQFMWIDLRDDSENARQLDRLAAVIRGEPVEREGQRDPRATVCPYRGLLPFREEDAAFFFGRESYIEQLLAKVTERPLVAVVGDSGSGKSSVVRAGLVPQLRSEGRRPVWDIVTIVPGEHPLHALADGLLPLVEPDLTGLDLIRKRNLLADDLKQVKVPLWDLAVEALRGQPGTDRLLLVVDQWEELYTQCVDADECRRFIDELLDATRRKQFSLSVVLTVRSDFYTEILRDRPLLDRLQDAKLDIGPMNDAELRAIIEQPVKNVGLTFQDGLVERILDDASESPGRLPLLEFALEELWQRRDGVELTHAAYKALGRLSGAIAAHAEAVYGGLDAAEQETAPRLFRRLVRAGSKTEEDTRRRADLRAMDPTTQRVALHLADERLLVTSRTTTGDEGQEVVEVAHEELLRRWGRLGKWVNEDRRFLQWRGRLVPLLEEHNRDPAFVLRGGAFREGRQFYPARQEELEPIETAFLKASAAAERRRRFKLWSSVCAVLIVVCCIAVGAWLLNQSTQRRFVVDRAVEDLADPLLSNVAVVLEKLDASPPYAKDTLKRAYDETKEPRARLRLAYGLIAVGAVTAADDDVVNFIMDEIARAASNDSANLVDALSQLPLQDAITRQLLLRAGDASATDPMVRTRYLVAALSLGDLTPTKELEIVDGNPDQRTKFIRVFPTWPGDLRRISALLPQMNVDARSGLCTAIGGVDATSRSLEECHSVRDMMMQLYVNAADPGTHSAAGWALRQWKLTPPMLPPCVTEGEREQWTKTRSWYVNRRGMTMLRMPLPPQGGPYRIGSPGLIDNEPREVPASEFWLSDCEVTVGQFKALLPGVADVMNGWSDPNMPVCFVTWFDALMFCNRLSEDEHLAPCYRLSDVKREILNNVTDAQVETVTGPGYRLPTEEEWEIACRAMTKTNFSFGSSFVLLDSDSELNDYGWFLGNSGRKLHPVAEKRPNPWGLHDMHGNVYEWCGNPKGLFRGGSYDSGDVECWSASLIRSREWKKSSVGFRVARNLSGR